MHMSCTHTWMCVCTHTYIHVHIHVNMHKISDRIINLFFQCANAQQVHPFLREMFFTFRQCIRCERRLASQHWFIRCWWSYHIWQSTTGTTSNFFLWRSHCFFHKRIDRWLWEEVDSTKKIQEGKVQNNNYNNKINRSIVHAWQE